MIPMIFFISIFNSFSMEITSDKVVKLDRKEFENLQNYTKNLLHLKEKGIQLGLYIGRTPDEVQPPTTHPLFSGEIKWTTLSNSPGLQTSLTHLAVNISFPLIFESEGEILNLRTILSDTFHLITFDSGVAYSACSDDAFVNYASLLKGDSGKILFPAELVSASIFLMERKDSSKPFTAYYVKEFLELDSFTGSLEDILFIHNKLSNNYSKEIFYGVVNVDSIMIITPSGPKKQTLDKRITELAIDISRTKYLNRYFENVIVSNIDFTLIRGKNYKCYELTTPKVLE